jgi:hypothetical protein
LHSYPLTLLVSGSSCYQINKSLLSRRLFPWGGVSDYFLLPTLSCLLALAWCHCTLHTAHSPEPTYSSIQGLFNSTIPPSLLTSRPLHCPSSSPRHVTSRLASPLYLPPPSASETVLALGYHLIISYHIISYHSTAENSTTHHSIASGFNCHLISSPPFSPRRPSPLTRPRVSLPPDPRCRQREEREREREREKT